MARKERDYRRLAKRVRQELRRYRDESVALLRDHLRAAQIEQERLEQAARTQRDRR
jgi:hypothetical protein